MKERPFICSGDEVRAILDGSKTHARRIVKPQPSADVMNYWPVNTGPTHENHCPYGKPGDRMWARETWAKLCDQDTLEEKLYYKADKESENIEFCDGDGYGVYRKNGKPASKWLPSIHMPRWASRITLEITGIRVERLQDISEEDAKAEGAEYPGCAVWADRQTEKNIRGYRLGFLGIWESIHGLGSWDRNDWVWVVSFRKLDA